MMQPCLICLHPISLGAEGGGIRRGPLTPPEPPAPTGSPKPTQPNDDKVHTAVTATAVRPGRNHGAPVRAGAPRRLGVPHWESRGRTSSTADRRCPASSAAAARSAASSAAVRTALRLRRRRDCHSAPPPLTRCFNRDGEGVSAKWQKLSPMASPA